MVCLRIKDIFVDSEIWYEIVFLPWVSIFLELAWCCSFCFALNTVAGWDRSLLSSHNPCLAALSSFAECLRRGSIMVGVKDVMINSKVGDGVVFIPWIGILLKLRRGSSLGLAFNRVACRNGCLLGSNLPGLTTSGVLSGAVGLGGGGIAMSSNDVVVHSKVWNKVVFVPWISIFLKLRRGSGLGLAFNRVAGWD